MSLIHTLRRDPPTLGGFGSSPRVIAPAGTASNFSSTFLYGHASSLNDVTSGSNGTCTTTKWCTAGAGWDGPTGLGTPNGTGAF